MIRILRFVLIISIAVILAGLPLRLIAIDFTATSDVFPNIWNTSAAWGDYDNDGDLDLVIEGDTTVSTFFAKVPMTKIYRNDNGNLVDINADLIGVYAGSVEWGDYDNDGDLDLLVGGYISSSVNKTRIYRNDNGTFNDISANLPDANHAAWGDYDNDGDLDIALCGLEVANYTLAVCRNDGGKFIDIGANLEAVNGNIDWIDYDNDGDLDLCVSGAYSYGCTTRIYKNDNGTLTQSSTNIASINGSMDWGDYDNDGDLDMLLIGRDTSLTALTKVFRNDAGSLVDTGASITGFMNGDAIWGDFDNDGDLDAFITGADRINGFCYTKLFQNDNGSFTDPGVLSISKGGSAAIGDYDNDGDLDLFVAGSEYCKILKASGGVVSSSPSAPSNLAATVTQRDVTLTWNTSTDTQTPANGLTYNVRIGTTSGGSETVSGMSTGQGARLIVSTGNAGQNSSWTYKNLRGGHYYCSVQAVDGTFAGSPWSEEQEFTIDYRCISGVIKDIKDNPVNGVSVQSNDGTASSITDEYGYYELWLPSGWSGTVTPEPAYGMALNPASRSYANLISDTPDQDYVGTGGLIPLNTSFLAAKGQAAWGDYDNDGDLDLIVVSAASSILYRNDNGNLVDSGISIPIASSVAWGDYDNDGDLDLALGSTGENLGNPARIYRNDNGAFNDSGISLPKMADNPFWADFDNDGDLDLSLSGDGVDGCDIYRNDNGQFNRSYAAIPKTDGPYVWGDYDNDGDLDLASFNSIYRNDNGRFTDIKAGLSALDDNGAANASFTWGDYDGDGDLDLAFTGYIDSSNYAVKIYRNDNGVFTDINAGLAALYLANTSWADYDNDGDLDLLLTGVPGYSYNTIPVTILYRNDAGTFVEDNMSLTGIYQGASVWADYDNDGDLDLVLNGYSGSYGSAIPITKVYRNNNAVVNQTPNTPASLSAAVSAGKVTFSWEASSDDITPQKALSYNLRIGTTPGKDDVFSGMADTANGLRRISAVGNAEYGLSWSLNIPAGSYYWSVQALDSSLKGSVWAAEQTLSVDTQKISGCVRTDDGAQLANIMLSLDNGSKYITDATGYYEFWVPTGWSGSITPSKLGYEISPVIRSYENVTCTQTDQDFVAVRTLAKTDMSLTAMYNGSLAWGDYDSDGDLDLIAAGYRSSTSSTSYLYRNDSGILVNSGINLGAISKPQWLDYDGDGDLDIACITSTGLTIKLNNNGTFEDSGILIPDVKSFVFGDCDNDGDQDLLVSIGTYSSKWTFSTKLLINTGNSFIDSGTKLTGINGTLAWIDYDNDGDLDFFMCGHINSDSTEPQYYLMELHRNDSGKFTSVISQTGINGIPTWGDYDSDGDLDLALSGTSTRLFRNDSGTLTEIDAGLSSINSNRFIVWGDYDNDGDLDLFTAGVYDYNTGIVKILRNDAGTFTDIDAGLPQIKAASGAWGDFNNDGRLDLALMGDSSTSSSTVTPITAVYQNNTPIANSSPSMPGELSAALTNGTVKFGWSSASDTQTPAAGLSYNLRVGTSPGASDIYSGSASATGYRYLPAQGNAGELLNWSLNNAQPGAYYWSVQTIDSAMAGSQWAPEQSIAVGGLITISGRVHVAHSVGLGGASVKRSDGSWVATDSEGNYSISVPSGWTGTLTAQRDDYVFTPENRSYTNITQNQTGQDFSGAGGFVDSGISLPGVYYSSLAWGDYDNDGLQDLALAGTLWRSGMICKIYHNDGITLTDSGIVITATSNRKVAWSDYDNDGDLDLCVSGSSTTSYTTVYKNNNGVISNSGIILPTMSPASISWGDYDNDGDLDLAGGDYNSNSKIYRNDNGTLVSAVSNLRPGYTTWADYDNDGDLDLSILGSYGIYLYNNAGGKFTEKQLTSISASNGVCAWGDYDSDGDLDLLAISNYASRIYRNNGSTFSAVSGLVDVGYGFAAWGDYDNDGDLDLAISGVSLNTTSKTRIYRNDNGTFTDIGADIPYVYTGYVGWVDYDNDGDLDLSIAGCSSDGYITKIYRNDGASFNTAPSAPTILQASTGTSGTTFTWNAATDAQTPSAGLSYNLRVGTTPGGNDVFCGMSDNNTGRRLLPALGNAQCRLSWTLKNLPNVPIYWSVQSIDSSFAGSNWASGQVYANPCLVKSMVVGESIQTSGIVTAVFDDMFYIEQENRISGIRVEADSTGLSVGKRVTVNGIIGTNSNGELYIAASSVTSIGTGIIKPMGLNNFWLGGGSFGYQHGMTQCKIDNAGQSVTSSAAGLSNVGMLVKIWGKIIPELTTADSFTIDDGSGTRIKCVIPTGVVIDPIWDYVCVTGICSCEKVRINENDELHALIRVRAQDDIMSCSRG